MRVLRQLATRAAHPSKMTEALSLREEGFAFLTCGRGRAASPRRRGRTASRPRVAASQLEQETDHEQDIDPAQPPRLCRHTGRQAKILARDRGRLAAPRRRRLLPEARLSAA